MMRLLRWADRYKIPTVVLFLGNSLVALVVFAAIVFLSACAGHQAMIWKPMQPPKQQCAIVVCEGHGGRIDPEKDCNKCAERMEDILR